ncbi:MAG TPA: hypothetical protein PLM63_04000 [bacterium]|nr:hypothetical protein [bacterium]
MFNGKNEIRFNLVEKRIEKLEMRNMELETILSNLVDKVTKLEQKEVKKELEEMKTNPVIINKKGRPKKV